jgi:lipopolysaccharide/colanic/teichoic acid biosynthesis glycosyltransferase
MATAPLVLIAMLAIRVSSRGPVFYFGKRCGLGDTQFTCLKLRTMHVNHDAILKKMGLNNLGADGRLLVFDHDPRIGAVGRCLRKFSIDEIPQLLNVLAGDMSLIGPRPLPPSMLQDFSEIRAMRSVVRPGISGLWQVRHRQKNASVLDMVNDDLEYIRDFSLSLDFKIALATIPRIIEPSRAERQPTEEGTV